MKYDVQTLDNITEKLIDFSRKIAYRFEYGDINMTIKNCISSLIFNSQYSLKPQLEDHNANQAFKPDMSNIDVLYSEELPLVEFDEEQFGKALTYILVYLMSNMKNTGKIVISSTVARSEYDDKSICITITGIGYEPAATELQQLFDPFNIEESNLIDVGPCIAQKIIEEHDGRLSVRQAKNGQATFVISLPASR
jgi:K+-sensing histidine kinase KdpD